MATVCEPFAFRVTPAALAAALDAFDELASAGGGAVDAARRREALAAYPKRAAATRVRLRGWRHDYARLRFEDLTWRTGRQRVPALPPAPAVRRARDAEDGEPPALAVDNAGGIVHLGAVYLQPQRSLGDPARRARESRGRPGEAPRERRRRARAPDPLRCRPVRRARDRVPKLRRLCRDPGGRRARGTAAAGLRGTALGDERRLPAERRAARGGRARATIVERHLGERDGFVAGTVEIDLAEGAELDYVAIQQSDDGARVAIRRAARVGAGARIGWHVADLGGALARTALATTLAGAGAAAATNVLGFARGYTNLDHAFATVHDASGRSSGVVRTVLLDRSRARLAHALSSSPAAEGGNAAFHADALVLGAAAAVTSRPAFSIATPGLGLVQSARAGSLDRDQLFYVTARGIAPRAAERMIALAFFEPAIVRLPSEALRDEIRTALDEKLDEIPGTFE